MNSQIFFPLVTENISINLVNTEIIRHGKRIDLLNDIQDLTSWLENMKHEKYIHPQLYLDTDTLIKESTIEHVKDLRLLLRRIYEAYAENKKTDEDWLITLEKIINRAPFAFHYDDNKLWMTPKGTQCDSLLSLIAYDALKLYTEDALKHMHHCANPDCVLLFMDKVGRRKWCSMKICGNRQKANRHQQRKRNQDI